MNVLICKGEINYNNNFMINETLDVTFSIINYLDIVFHVDSRNIVNVAKMHLIVHKSLYFEFLIMAPL